MPTRIVSLTLLAIACTAAVEEAPTIIVTAERGESELARAPVSVEVVEASTISERGGAINVTDWLRDLPGIGVWATGGGVDGGVVAVRLRGLDQKYTQYLVDGVPLSDQSSLNGAVRQPLYQPVGLSTIEVLKGSQSGLYGSGAIGGVINQLTARPTEQNELQAEVTAGSFSSLAGQATATGPLTAGLGFAVSIEGLRSDGFSAQTTSPDGDPEGFENDEVERFGGRARIESRAIEGVMLYAAGAVSRNSQDYDGTGPDDTASHNQFEQWQISGGGRLEEGHAWDASLDLSYQESVNYSYFAGPDPGTFSASTAFGALSIGRMLDQYSRLGFGVDVRRETAETRYAPTAPSPIDDRVDQAGLYATAMLGEPRWQLSATARADHHEEFGVTPTGRLAGAWFLVPEECKLRAAVSSGFRAPTLYELYHFEPGFLPFYPDSVGNPDLNPESSISYEAGVDWLSTIGIDLSATAFRTQVEDQVVFASSPGPAPSTYQNNDGSTTSQGIEAGLGVEEQVAAGHTLRLDAAYTWLDTEDPQGDDVPFAPEHAGSLRLTAGQEAMGDWRFWQSAAARRTTSFYANTGELDYLPGATVAEATLGVSWREQWQVTLRVDNLFDETYVPNQSFGQTYASAPRSYWLNVSGRF